LKRQQRIIRPLLPISIADFPTKEKKLDYYLPDKKEAIDELTLWKIIAMEKGYVFFLSRARKKTRSIAFAMKY